MLKGAILSGKIIINHLKKNFAIMGNLVVFKFYECSYLICFKFTFIGPVDHEHLAR